MGTSIFPSPGATIVTSGDGLSGIGSLANPLVASVDGTSIDVNGSGELEVVGGGGILHQATVTLTNAQIKALPTTGITLVAAQGANTIIIPTSASAVVNTVAASYSLGIGGEASFLLKYAGPTGIWITNITLVTTVITVQQITPLFFACPLSSLVGIGDFAGEIATVFPSPYTLSANLDLQIKDDYSGNADYTGGNAANTMVVSVSYLVLNILTGVFS